MSDAQRRRQAKREQRVIKQKAAQNQDGLVVIQKFVPVRIRLIKRKKKRKKERKKESKKERKKERKKRERN